MNLFNHSREMRLACPNFTASEIDAVRCLLQLIKPYLKQSWDVVDSTQGDVLLVNLDHPHDPLPARVKIVGCAQRPRLHPMGTLHRPLRVAEMLALLADVGASISPSATTDASEAGIEWHYDLRAWPLDFQQWPKEVWRVLAILRGAHHSVGEIAERARLPVDEVERHIAMLHRAELLNRYGERRAPVALPAPAWRGLAARVGNLLGFR